MPIQDTTQPPQDQIAQPRQDAALKARIAAHTLDKPWAKLPFSKRLARENGWPHAYALRVIEEYRRFVYLACIAGEELTPSDEVDQAWHLHLAYSRDYWERFCPDVLARPLHHGPTDGGDADDARFADNYRRTLALYAAVFGQDPPPDIWPPAQLRFGYADTLVRVNRALFSLKPKDTPKPPPTQTHGSLSLSRWPVWTLWGLFAFIFLFDTYGSQGGGALGSGGVHFYIAQVIKALVIAGFCTVGLVVMAAFLGYLAQRARRPEAGPIFTQPQHGYAVTYTMGLGTAVIVAVSIGGDGSGEGGGGGDGGGGCGGGGCGGGCGG